jgi:hypothetical protein
MNAAETDSSETHIFADDNGHINFEEENISDPTPEDFVADTQIDQLEEENNEDIEENEQEEETLHPQPPSENTQKIDLQDTDNTIFWAEERKKYIEEISNLREMVNKIKRTGKKKTATKPSKRQKTKPIEQDSDRTDLSRPYSLEDPYRGIMFQGHSPFLYAPHHQQPLPPTPYDYFYPDQVPPQMPFPHPLMRQRSRLPLMYK